MILLTTLTAVLTLLFFIWRARKQHNDFLNTVEVVTLTAVYSKHLDNQRDIQVFLPPSYHDGHESSYKSLYINDGQDMEALGLRETLARLYQRDQIDPLIVVAVPTNADRLQEYGTAVAPNAQNLGTKAPEYAQFIIKELVPFVRTKFAVSDRGKDTAVLGASLGGLSAFDLAWNFPDQFGTLGVFSGSFWWRAAANETQITPRKLIAHEMVKKGEYYPGRRAWFEAGTYDERSDRDNNGVIDAIQDTLELIDALEGLGYRCGVEIEYVEVVNGRHDWPTWAEVLPDFLQWAFPARRK